MKVCRKCQEEKPLEEFSQDARYRDGAYPWCRKCKRIAGKQRYWIDPARARALALAKPSELPENRMAKRRERRKATLDHYGGKCVCCGESTFEFLAFDHIRNNGSEHRKAFGARIDTWLRVNGYPSDVQILCHNCNLAKGYYGRCPHTLPT